MSSTFHTQEQSTSLLVKKSLGPGDLDGEWDVRCSLVSVGYVL